MRAVVAVQTGIGCIQRVHNSFVFFQANYVARDGNIAHTLTKNPAVKPGLADVLYTKGVATPSGSLLPALEVMRAWHAGIVAAAAAKSTHWMRSRAAPLTPRLNRRDAQQLARRLALAARPSDAVIERAGPYCAD